MEKNFFQACSEGDLAQVKLFLSINQEKINEKNANARAKNGVDSMN